MATLGVNAEWFVFDDPDTALVELRQFGERPAQEGAASLGMFESPGEPQADLLRRSREAGIMGGRLIKGRDR